MKRSNLFIIVTLFLGVSQLNAQNDWLSKKYYGYHTHDSHELQFDGVGVYLYISNNNRQQRVKGRYELQGDTLILHRPYFANGEKQECKEYYLRHGDNCIVLLPWRYGYYNSLDVSLGEKEINVNYPQLPMKNGPKEEVEKMIQTVIDSIKTKSAYDSTMTIKPYYEVNSSNGYSFERLGSKMSFITKADTANNYLKIETIGLGVENAVVIITIQPFLESRNNLVATFKKINGKWVVDGRINY